MGDLGWYRSHLRDRKAGLSRQMLSGDFSPLGIAQQRLAIEFCELQLKRSPEYVLSFDTGKPSRYAPAELWFLSNMEEALKTIDPAKRDPRAFKFKMEEYRQLAEEIRTRSDETQRIETYYEVYMVHASELTRQLNREIALALLDYAYFHRYDDDFLTVPAKTAYLNMLVLERPDLMADFRLASSIPGEVTRMSLPAPPSDEEERPGIVVAAEFAISLIPFVGSAVMAYEALSGKDLFGYKLSDAERGMLGMCVLLPVVARFVEADRAVYSAARMTTLYGGEAKVWSHTIAMAERTAADPKAIYLLREAQRTFAATGRIERSTADELGKWIQSIDFAKAEQGVPTVLSKPAVDTFERLVAANERWMELDANAIERIARKKWAPHIQGEMTEELVGNRVTVWLRDPAGKSALLLTEFEGRLEFIPGHLIRDVNGRQLTDGLIVIKRSDDTYLVAAIIEVKSGERSAAGLGSGTIGSLKPDQRAALFAEADDVFAALRERSRRTGIPMMKTRDDVIKDLLKAHPGQLKRDIKRIKTNPDVFIGGLPFKLEFSERSTKLFGFMPSDVTSREIAAVIRESGVNNFVSFGIGFTKAELKEGSEVAAGALGLAKKKVPAKKVPKAARKPAKKTVPKRTK